MDKQAHIDYWVTSAKDDEDIMHYLYNGKKYVHALFFGHLMIEKICKTLWVKNQKSNVAPKSLRIAKILNSLNIELNSEQHELIEKLYQFRMQVCCPNPLITFDKIAVDNFEKDYVQKIIEVKSLLLYKLH